MIKIQSLYVLLICVLSATLTGCGYIIKGFPSGESSIVIPRLKELPKPKDPAAEKVDVPFIPKPSESQGTVVVNVKNAAAKVSLVTNIKRTALNIEGEGQVVSDGTEKVDMDTRLLCARTPCAFNLPYGSATLHIAAPPADGWESSTDLCDIDVIPNRTLLVTHIMSRAKTETLSPRRESSGETLMILLETVGWTGAIVGGIVAATMDDGGPLGIGVGIGSPLLIALGVVIYDPGEERVDQRTFSASATTVSPYPLSATEEQTGATTEQSGAAAEQTGDSKP